jgi:SAM-dependent methyltransferase
MSAQLLLGCGRRRDKCIFPRDAEREFSNCIALDIDNAVRIGNEPFVECDLNGLQWLFERWYTAESFDIAQYIEPYPGARNALHRFKQDTFDEVHAYECLEHLGRQGDYLSFFAHFTEVWRILKPDGILCATVPSRFSPWLWGDPGHCRALLPESLAFLSLPNYSLPNRGPMTDYRPVFGGDFDTLYAHDNHTHFGFMLRAVKPARKDAMQCLIPPQSS